jgi:cytochrome d ubiquinol oxidase subunit I
MKLAASEAHWQTKDSAPLIIFAVINESTQTNSYEVALPGWLSLLTYNSLNAPVSGMQDIQAESIVRFGPGNYIPPVNILFWSLRLMVGIGFFLFFLLSITLWYWRKDVIEVKGTLLKIIIASLPLPYLAITTGWIMAEVGRQPWIVYGLLPTSSGSSKPVQAVEVWTSLLLYTGIYSLIAAAALYITRKTIITGPQK